MGAWWEAKAGKEAFETDIVGIHTDGKSALVAEVKRDARNFDRKAFNAKAEHLKTKILAGLDTQSRLYTLDDM